MAAAEQRGLAQLGEAEVRQSAGRGVVSVQPGPLEEREEGEACWPAGNPSQPRGQGGKALNKVADCSQPQFPHLKTTCTEAYK